MILAAIKGQITPPSDTIRIIKAHDSSFLLKQSFPAVITSIFILALYSTVSSFSAFWGFEKTQTLELSYFPVFLISCILECTRLGLSVFYTWQTSSSYLLVLGRIIIVARILAPLSLLFASLFNQAGHRQDTSRNILILFLASISTGLFYPLNSNFTFSTCTVVWGYRTFFIVIRALIVILTLSTFVISGIVHSTKQSFYLASGCAVMLTGYFMLISADCWLFTILGTAFLIPGTVWYLTSLHKLYTWN